jgi:hypothetical protein
MRIGLIVAGLILVTLGGLVAMGKLDYTRDREVLKLGELSAKVEEQRSVPEWVGGVGIVVGVGLLALGATRKR